MQVDEETELISCEFEALAYKQKLIFGLAFPYISNNNEINLDILFSFLKKN